MKKTGVIYQMYAEERKEAYRALGEHVMQCSICNTALNSDNRCPEGRVLGKKVTIVGLRHTQEATEMHEIFEGD